ncbi:MAG: Gfo/Idh/MocA family protein [Humibacter sp.]
MGRHTAAVVAAGGQARVHATAYSRFADLVAVADPVESSREGLAAELGIPRTYADFERMLREERPEIVSVCTPPALHKPAVLAAIAAGAKAVHCEKPIALSYADVLELVEAAERAGVQLTFNLQRRFDPVQVYARDAIRSGAIGEVLSFEAHCPNLLDWGSHIVDLLLFYRDDVAPIEVLGQVDVSVNRYVYGALMESASLTSVSWADGVHATVTTGRDAESPVLHPAVPLGVIVEGSLGRITVTGDGCDVQRFDAPTERFESPTDRNTSTWDHGIDPAIFAATSDAIEDLIDALDSGREPACAARLGAAGAELIFATYQSSAARARVILPLDRAAVTIPEGIENGYWHPVGETASTY